MVVLPLLGSDKPYELKPSKIIALGLNYRDHVAESPSILAARSAGQDRFQGAAALGPEGPGEPVLFPKTPNVLIGPGDPIVLPTSFIAHYGFEKPRTDYEAELAIVIGRRMRRVEAAEARAYVLGYTCFNDVSQRNIQNGDRSGWFRGKSFDSFGPIGPAIVPESRLGDPQNLEIQCRLNGKTVQRSNTAAMIFPIHELLSYISWNFSLEPGDIVITGTPSGVGAIKEGDVVEVEIEGIGTLKNPVVEE